MSGGRGNCGEKVGNGEEKDCRLFRLVPNFFFIKNIIIPERSINARLAIFFSFFFFFSSL